MSWTIRARSVSITASHIQKSSDQLLMADLSIPRSPASTASTASIASNGEVIPARKKQRLSSTSTASTASTNSIEGIDRTGSKSDLLLSTSTMSRLPLVSACETKSVPIRARDEECAVQNGADDQESQVSNQQRFESLHEHCNAFSPGETPEQFVKRLPPSTTTRDEVGDWIWMHDPDFDQSCLPRPAVNSFIMEGEVLLRSFDIYKEDVLMSTDSARVKQAKLKASQENLPSSIKELAQTHRVTHGKWMLFPLEEDVDETWLKVVQSCSAGKLGTGAKVAPAGADQQPSRLICIYTKDYSDMDDVKRVLVEIRDCGLVSDGGRPIYYKADAWTYLGIDSKNNYGLRASLYCSRDILEGHKNNQPKINHPMDTKPPRKTGRSLPW